MKILFIIFFSFSYILFAQANNTIQNTSKSKRVKKLGVNIKPGRWIFRSVGPGGVQYDMSCIKNPTTQLSIKRLMSIYADPECKVTYHKQGNFKARMTKQCREDDGSTTTIKGVVYYKNRRFKEILTYYVPIKTFKIYVIGKYVNHCYQKAPKDIKKFFKK